MIDDLTDEAHYTEAYHPGRRANDREQRPQTWRTTAVILAVSLLVGLGGLFVLNRVLVHQQHTDTAAQIAAKTAAAAKAQLAHDKDLLVASRRDACDRANVVREELNSRIRAHSIDRAVLLQALKLAATGGQLKRSFAHLRDIERRYVHFRKLALIDCSQIGKPPPAKPKAKS